MTRKIFIPWLYKTLFSYKDYISSVIHYTCKGHIRKYVLVLLLLSSQEKSVLILFVLTGQQAGGSQSGSGYDGGQEKDLCPCQVSNYPHTAYSQVLYEHRTYQDMKLSMFLLSIHTCARMVPMNMSWLSPTIAPQNIHDNFPISLQVPWIRWLVTSFYLWGSDSLSVLPMQNFWWTKWHWGRFSPEYFGFSPSVLFHLCSTIIHSPITSVI